MIKKLFKKKNKETKNFVSDITMISFKDIKNQTINLSIKDGCLYIQNYNAKLQFILNDENAALLDIILRDFIVNGNFETVKQQLS